MNDIEQIISAILSRYNLSSEEGRENAYEECVEYAEKELSRDLRCNAFLRASAQMLEREPVEYDIIRDLVDLPEGAKVDISFDERHGFIVTANAEGLEYLGDLIKTLGKSPPGEHVHLYNDEEPLTPISFNGLIFIEEDEWFDNIEHESPKDGQNEESPRRPLSSEDVYALQIIGPIPPDIDLTRDRIYRVKGVDVSGENEAWKKTANGDADRYVKFKVIDDNSEEFEIILHLDDPDINYFKIEDFLGMDE